MNSMSGIDWDSFRASTSDPRFLLPLSNFEFRLQYVPIRPDQQQVVAAYQQLAQLLADIVRRMPHQALAALSLRLLQAATDSDEEREPVLLGATYGLPVYDFGLAFGPTTMLLRKASPNLEELIRSLPLLSAVAKGVFGAGGPPIADILGLNYYSFSFRFEYRLSLSSRITNPQQELTTLDLIDKLLKVRLPSGSNAGQEAPLGALNAEEAGRWDVTYSFTKTFAEKTRNLWVIMEAPTNVTRRDLDLKFDYRSREDGPGMTVEDLSDWDTPFVDFFQGLVLNRFLPDLLHDANVQPRFG